MARRMNWDKVHDEAKIRWSKQLPTKIYTKVDVGRDFWVAWRENKEAMKKQGYAVRKVDGKWQVYLVTNRDLTE
jgi:hypothetical protein